MLNALTRSSSPTEFDCDVNRFESGSVIAQYRVRVGEETEDEAENAIERFETILMEIVTEAEQEHLTGDGMDSIVIAKVIRGVETDTTFVCRQLCSVYSSGVITG